MVGRRGGVGGIAGVGSGGGNVSRDEEFRIRANCRRRDIQSRKREAQERCRVYQKVNASASASSVSGMMISPEFARMYAFASVSR